MNEVMVEKESLGVIYPSPLEMTPQKKERALASKS